MEKSSSGAIFLISKHEPSLPLNLPGVLPYGTIAIQEFSFASDCHRARVGPGLDERADAGGSIPTDEGLLKKPR